MVFIMTAYHSVNAGSIDTISHYSTGSMSYNMPIQYARFETPGPCTIKSIIITLGGTSNNGSVKVNLFGHEGGDIIPQLRQALMPPVVLRKTTSGEERIQYDLHEPVYINNRQFFLEVSEFSPQTTLVSDNTVKTDFCLAGSSGGDFYFQFFQNLAGNYSYGTRAFKIDIIVEREKLPKSPWFEEVTDQVGILSSSGTNRGIAVGDFNGNGYQDLLRRNILYRNDNGVFTDITTSAGIFGTPRAAVFADMDNDGLLDILSVLDTCIIIFQNNGDETFTPHVVLVNTDNHGYRRTQALSVGDINNNGYPDVFIGQIWNTYPDPLPNFLYLNNGDFTFTDITHVLYPSASVNNRASRASQFIDYNNNGLLDLYVSNYLLQKDELWENNGDTTFTNVIHQKNIDVNTNGYGSNHGTGVAWADYNNSLNMDLLSPHLAHPRFVNQFHHQGTTLYRNEGPPDYEFSDLIGAPHYSDDIQFEETHAGAAWGDVNNDGLLDFFITNFYRCRYSDLYIQQQDNSFKRKTQYFMPCQRIDTGDDCLFFDFNNDGKLDLVVAEHRSFIQLYQNNEPSNNNYVAIELRSTTQNKFALGARAYLYAQGEVYMREVCTGRGARMGDPYRLHFGIGKATSVDSVVVRWPGGQTQETFLNIIVNNINMLTEGGVISYLGNEFDIAPEMMLAPMSGCGFSANEDISIRIRNYGHDTINEFYAAYIIDSVYSLTDTVSMQILPGAYLDYTFVTKADLSATGTYTFSFIVSTAADNNNNNDTLRNIVINNGPQIDIPNFIEICEGDTVYIDATIDYAASYQYQWTGPLQSTNPEIALYSEGLFYINVTDSCGNIATDSVYLALIPYPVASLGSDTSFIQGSSVTLDAQNTGASYYWSTGEVTQTITVTQPGTYFVNMYNGTCMASDTIKVNLTNIVQSSLKKPVFHIYPNPAKEVINIVFENKIFEAPINVEIIDVTGKLIRQSWHENTEITLDISHISQGVYFLRIDNLWYKKFIKE